jgi:hypothetical protein
MADLREGLARLVGRVLGELPSWIVKKIPDWIAGLVKTYIRWLWNLDVAMKFVMLLVNVVAVQIIIGSIAGSSPYNTQLVSLLVLGFVAFFGASVVFGRRRG